MSDFSDMVEGDFEDFMLADLGESVTYYANSGSYGYSSASATDVDGYLVDGSVDGSPTTLDVIIATFTQKDIDFFDLGSVSVDDHKVYIPNSVTPDVKDRLVRGDGDEFEVVSVMHEHAVAGNKTFYTCHIRRRRT